MITQVRFTENQLDRKPKLFDAYVSLCNISVVILNKKYEKINSIPFREMAYRYITIFQ